MGSLRALCSLFRPSVSSSLFQSQQKMTFQRFGPSWKRYYQAGPTTSEEETQNNTLSIPELAKSIVLSRISGTLSTISLTKDESEQKGPGIPLYGSLIPFIITSDQKLGLALRIESRHVENIEENNLCSMVVNPIIPVSYNPSLLPLPRVNLTGNLVSIEKEGLEDFQSHFLEVHPGAQEYLDEMNFYQIKMSSKTELALYLPSQGTSEYFSNEEYLAAPLDPLAKFQRYILERMNNHHSEELGNLVCHYTKEKFQSVIMYQVDRFGFNILASDSHERWTDIRLPFPFSVSNEEECNRVLREALQHAAEETKEQKAEKLD